MPRICSVFLSYGRVEGFLAFGGFFFVRVYVRVSYGCVGLRFFRV